jgi:hypothetical protein
MPFLTFSCLSVLPSDPDAGKYMMEDVFFYHALELLDYSLPSVQQQAAFAVQGARLCVCLFMSLSLHLLSNRTAPQPRSLLTHASTHLNTQPRSTTSQ